MKKQTASTSEPPKKNRESRGVGHGLTTHSNHTLSDNFLEHCRSLIKHLRQIDKKNETLSKTVETKQYDKVNKEDKPIGGNLSFTSL